MKKTFVKNSLMAILGASVMAFGLYEIHSFSGVTEGGILGASLLLEKHFSLSPATTSLIMNIICYAVGFKILGRSFLVYSSVATLSFSLIYRILELTPPLFKGIYQYPLVAALAGAIFIGVGAGLCVRAGGAPSGDDALAMSFSRLFKVKIEIIYLISDLVVILLSLSYIPWSRLIYSFITVLISGKIIGIVVRYK